MSRPYSWYPLASSDPVPGDPAVVRSGGDHYRQIATAIGDAERVLRTLVDAQDAVSQAVEAIRDRTHAVADRIRQAHGRYDTAGDALVGYAIQLDLAQSESLDALHLAQTAQRRLDLADESVRRWTLATDDAEDHGEDALTLRRALGAARQDRSDAEYDLARARLQLEEAVARRDDAAQRATDRLDTGTADGLDDGWWEDWGADVAQVVSTWGGNIATVTGMLTLVLGWVPILGQVLAVVTVAAGAVALVADIALAIKTGDGQAWFNVAMGLVGLVTFGAGRALAGAVDAFSLSARAASSQAAVQASRSLLSRLLPVPSRTPAAASVADTSMDSLAAIGKPFTGRLAAAWAQVRSARGMDRALALAGHGDLVTQNSALRAQLWDAFPFRPAAFLTLVGPSVQGAALEAAATVLYVGDTAMAFTAATKTAVDLANGRGPAPAERIQL